MAVFGNKEILIKYDELPEINGEKIKHIYMQQFDTRGIKDYTVRPEHASVYYHCVPYFNLSDRHEVQRVRKLPKEIQDIFDNLQVAEYKNHETGEVWTKKINVSSISFRTDCSGNGSFIDSSIDLSGGYGNNSAHLSVTRNDKYKTVTEQTGLYDRIIKMLNVKATIPVLSEEEYTYYPSTTLRKVDGLNYPDPVCNGWRWLHGMPYVPNNPFNRNSIRVFDEELKCHLYLNKVQKDEIEVGAEYIKVHFSYERDKTMYCNISKWADSKKDLAGQYIRYRIDSIDKKYIHVTVVDQQPRYAKEKYEDYLPDFYQIARIRNAEQIDE
jgi:hypothetical protein